jgi:integrase
MYRPAVGEPRWLTRAEFARLERELPEHLKAAAKFAVPTGLRMRAMLSLTWQQVDLAKKRAWVASSEMKAGHSLGVPLTPEAIQVLKALPKNGDYVFQWHGERIDDCNTLAFQKAVRRPRWIPFAGTTCATPGRPGRRRAASPSANSCCWAAGAASRWCSDTHTLRRIIWPWRRQK